MPVPVATTHAKGVGNAGANSAVLETAGPFARMTQAAAIQKSAETAVPATAAASNSSASYQEQAATAVTPPQPTAQYSVETDRLTFKYPGIGVPSSSLCRLRFPPGSGQACP